MVQSFNSRRGSPRVPIILVNYRSVIDRAFSLADKKKKRKKKKKDENDGQKRSEWCHDRKS